MHIWEHRKLEKTHDSVEQVALQPIFFSISNQREFAISLVIVAAEEFVKFEDLDRHLQLGGDIYRGREYSQNFFGLVGGR